MHNLYKERAKLYRDIADIKINNRFKFGRKKHIADKSKTFNKKRSSNPKQSQYIRDIRRFARSVAKRYKLHIRDIVERDIYCVGR